MIRALASLAALALAVPAASAQTLVPIHLTGDPDTRINYVIMADGFTAGEMDSFRTAADTFRDLLLGSSPYVRYADYINVYRLELVSNESGVSTPSTTVDTVLRSVLGCFSIDRLLCADNARGSAALTAADPDINFHIRLIVANSQTYGGGGGYFATTTLHPAAGSVFEHEIGHSYASLNDEYEDANICAQQPGLYGPPGEINTSAQSTRAASPWTMWIDAGTPVPTTGTTPSVPGMYEGGHYCSTGVWRPTYDSLMRSLNRPMDPINSEQFVRVFHRTASGFDAVNPPAGAVSVPRDGRIRFTAIPKTITGTAFGLTWRVNGQVVQAPAAADSGVEGPSADGIGFFADGTRYAFIASAFGPGQHTVTATLRDDTALVRNDPGTDLVHEQSWTVTVEDRDTPSARLAAAVLPYARSVSGGAAATAFATVINSGTDTATGCTLALQDSAGNASPATFSYRATDPATNTPLGGDNPTFTTGPGAFSTFVFSAAFAGTVSGSENFVVADCANSDPSPRGAGVNSALISSGPTATPDIVSVAATLGTPGVTDLPSNGGRGVFAVSAVNIGAAGDVIVRADLGPVSLPIEADICETNPATGQCVTDRLNRLPVTFGANEIKTFAVRLRARGPIQFAPERYRIFLLFQDGGNVSRGGTSVAVRTNE
ncbi:M64 family metallopeptidase [Hyphobacterium marinum]|uniref:M64 family metallopeptidase n=1 Tax=Hyphobacterium marinum TaxID=3116574 RepID=A0ABU7LZM4_9PROT|nr:M64 family metallopeptidase [Hyphobacterium sp. Y6023]MEE2567011.1 M64 family metallopeptidase [Hyphobacterium sp. Y6023]